jgi:hypothetical protein
MSQSCGEPFCIPSQNGCSECWNGFAVAVYQTPDFPWSVVGYRKNAAFHEESRTSLLECLAAGKSRKQTTFLGRFLPRKGTSGSLYEATVTVKITYAFWGTAEGENKPILEAVSLHASLRLAPVEFVCAATRLEWFTAGVGQGERGCSWFSPKGTTPHDLYEAMVTVKPLLERFLYRRTENALGLHTVTMKML